MKSTWILPLFAVAMVAVGCSSDNAPGLPESGQGKVQFDCQTSGEVAHVEARATTGFQLPAEVIPAADAFALTLKGVYTEKVDEATTAERAYEKSWQTLADYQLEAPELEAGIYDAALGHYANSYEATVSYGDPTVEGEGKACFTGCSVDATGAAAPFVLYAGKHVTVPVVAKLSNSCFTLEVTEWMLNYYTNVELTIHTATGEFTFKPTTTASSTLIFVKPDQQLSLSGKAVKAQNGVEVTFPKTTIGTSTVKAETHYAVKVDHSTAGSGALSISFDSSFTDVPAEDVELNPDEN